MDQFRTPYSRDYHNSPLFEQFGAPESMIFEHEKKPLASETYHRIKKAKKDASKCEMKSPKVASWAVTSEDCHLDQKQPQKTTVTIDVVKSEDCLFGYEWLTVNNVLTALQILFFVILIIALVITIVYMVKQHRMRVREFDYQMGDSCIPRSSYMM